MAAPLLEMKVDVQRLDEVQRAFGTALERIKVRVAQTLKESADELATKARAGAPVKSGALRQSIDRTEGGWISDNVFAVAVRPFGRREGQSKRNGNYAVGMFAESGLSSKRIWNIRKSSKYARAEAVSLKTGRKVKGTRYRQIGRGWWRNRPAIAARPFMQPAYASMKTRIVQNLMDSVRAATQEAVDAA